ncbi:MAG TPA: SRPBCC domain-containing protein [bacterium]|jgi:uncharacterized protein YndB with AHSA1/START domain
MHSFELKTVIAAPPHTVFAAITDPARITQWDYCQWVQDDMCLAGRIRKRDEEGRLIESEIVVYDPPFLLGLVTPLWVNTEDSDEGTFLTRQAFSIETHEAKSVLTLKMEGFPSEELCDRERNSWGGYFLEKLKKVAEATKEG